MIARTIQLKKECEGLLWDIDRRQPGGRGRHHLEVRLRQKLDLLSEPEDRELAQTGKIRNKEEGV